MTTVWIVGKTINDETSSWEFQGVFDTEEKAVTACVSDEMFVGPAKLNEAWPFETCEWDGAYYPQLGMVHGRRYIDCPGCGRTLIYSKAGRNYPCDRCGILWKRQTKKEPGGHLFHLGSCKCGHRVTDEPSKCPLSHSDDEKQQ